MSGQEITVDAAVVERGIARVVTTPPPAPGFVGAGHTAVMVVDPADFARHDPFIALMDDRLELEPGGSVGGAHPHAGFEIATFVLDGAVRDRDEGPLEAGDVMWMTAGSGVIHNEDVIAQGRVRILQLWMTLPRAQRWASPRIARTPRDAAPVRREPGVEARVYSGHSGSAAAIAHTYLPLTLVDIHLHAGAVFDQELPASYNGFLYVLDGDITAGSTQRSIATGQVGWLADAASGTNTRLRLVAGESGARVVLYAGERQGVPIVMHGPFVGETRADLMRVSQDYLQGKLPRVSQLAPDGISAE
jgi:redox-sensitive bicupin YhaK (pirin superfamily)